MPKVNFEGFMADNAQLNWNVVRKTYGDHDPSLSIVGRERTRLFLLVCKLEKGDTKVY